MDSCVISVTASQASCTQELYTELEKQYDSVAILAIGSEAAVESIKALFPEAITLLEVNDKHRDHQLILTSLSALLELGNSLKYFKTVTLWTDPVISYTGKYHSQDATQSSTTQEMICNTICDAVGELTSDSLVSKTKEGHTRWKNGYGISTPITTDLIPYNFSKDTSTEPLIEKSSNQRFLVDASGEHTTLPLVAPLLVLQEQTKKSDIWCYYDGELAQWMKPDFQIQHIPSNETPLYTNSVDGVILASDLLNKKRTIEYMYLGLFPIVINEKIDIELSKIIDTSAIRASFPSFGTETLISDLAESPERLQLYNSYSNSILKDSVIFNSDILKDCTCETQAYSHLLASKTYINSRELYLESNYGSSKGSELHKSISKLNNRIATIQGKRAAIYELNGWAVDKTELNNVDINVYVDNTEITALVTKHRRDDVTDALGLNQAEHGLQATFATSSLENTSSLKVAMSAQGHGIENFEAYEPHLIPVTDVKQDNEGVSKNIEPVLQGVLESLEVTAAKSIDLSKFTSIDCDLTLCLKIGDTAVSLNNTELYIASKERFEKVNSLNIEKADNTITLKSNELISPATLYIKSESLNDDATELTCHVFSDTDQIDNQSQQFSKSIDTTNTEGSYQRVMAN